MHELQSLQTDYSRTQRELLACTNELGILRGKIAEIDQIIEDFVQFKSDLREHRSEFKQLNNESYDLWQGELFDQYQGDAKADLYSSSLKDYISKVDDNLDNLNNERMRLQNEIYSTEGLIGNLKSAINWLSTKISNLLN